MMSADGKSKDAIVEKIKKLLRKAHGGTTQAEMEMLIAKAQELALQYQLDLASIDPYADVFTVGETSFYQNVRINNEVKFAAIIVQEHFSVTVYFMHHTFKKGFGKIFPNKSRHEIRVVGTEADQAVAKYIFDFLVTNFRQLWNEARASGRYPTKFPDGYRARHSYMYGLYKGVSDRLKEEKAKQCQERALMVISNKLVERKKYMDQNHGDIGEPDDINQAGWNSEAYQEGHEKGKALGIRPGMTAPHKVKKGELA